MKETHIKSTDLIIATSILCEVCFQREETCEPVTVKYFKKLGWKKIGDVICCPSCFEKEKLKYAN